MTYFHRLAVASLTLAASVGLSPAFGVEALVTPPPRVDVRGPKVEVRYAPPMPAGADPQYGPPQAVSDADVRFGNPPTQNVAVCEACFNPQVPPPPPPPIYPPPPCGGGDEGEGEGSGGGEEDKCKTPDAPPPNCKNSAIFHQTLAYIHTSIDFQAFGADGHVKSCRPCGGGSELDADQDSQRTQQYHLSIQRFIRPLSAGWSTSFGPGVVANFDVHLVWWTNADGTQSLRFRDPTTAGDIYFTLVNGAWQETWYSIYQPAVIQDAAGQGVTDLTQAASLKVTARSGLTYSFDHVAPLKLFRLRQIASSNGNGLQVAYTLAANASGYGDAANLMKVATITDNYGRTAVPAYAGTKLAGRFVITSMQMPNGQSVAYGYDTSRLKSVTYPDGTVGTMSVTVDSAQQLVQYAFFDPGADKPQHRTRTVFVTSSSLVLPDGTSTSISANRVRKVVNGAGEVSYWTHIMPMILPWGHRMQMIHYNGGKEMLAQHVSEGRVLSASYATAWSFSSDPSAWTWGDSSNHSYNSFGRDITNLDESGQSNAMQRDPVTGEVTKYTRADGSSTTVDYGPLLRVTRMVDSLGRATEMSYDGRGNLLARTEAAGTPEAATERWTYTDRGLVATRTDALGRVTSFGYDAAGYLISKTLPPDHPGDSSAVWRFEYDAAGNRIAVVDPVGRRVVTTLDARNRPIVVTYADTSTEKIVYGTGALANLVVERVDRNGIRTSYVYDGEGREISRTEAVGLPEALTVTTAYLTGTYDKVVRQTTGGETIDYTYDHRNRLVATTRHTTATNALTSSALYDVGGRRVAQQDAYGRSTYTVFDNRGRTVRQVQELISGGAGVDSAVAGLLATRYGAASTSVNLWTAGDFGTPSPAGATTVVAATQPWSFSLASSNGGFWGSADTGHFYGQPLPVDGELVARIDSHGFTDQYSRAGIMVRSARTRDAANVFLYATRDGLGVNARRQPGAGTEMLRWAVQSAAHLPYFLRLSRNGSAVTYATSPDGATWTPQGMIELPLLGDTVIGFALAGGSTNAAAFSAVTLIKSGAYPNGLVDRVRAEVVTGLPRVTTANPPYVVTEVQHDAQSHVTARIDGRGVVTRSVYDQRGRLTAETVADGTAEAATVRFAYDAVGNRVQVTGYRGQITRTVWTGRNLVASVTEAAGTPVEATTVFTYTLTGKVATTVDGLGRVVVNGYGTCCDRLETITDAAGFITRFGHDFVGNRTSVTDPNGLVTTTSYDGRNRPVRVTNATGEAAVMAYVDSAAGMAQAAGLGLGLGAGADGSAVLSTNPTGATSMVIRDGVGRVVRLVDALGQTTTTVFDQIQNEGGVALVAAVLTDALGQTSRNLTDGAGRLRVRIDVAGQRSTVTYDASGNRIAWRDANGVGQDCTFDARNREVTCVDTTGAVKRTTYDADGNRIIEVDALGSPINHVYDLRNRRLTTRDRIGALTTYAYDAVGNLLSITDAEGKVTQYAYDVRNLLVCEQFPDGQATLGGKDIRTYAYDAGRRLRTRTDQSAVITTYGYDAANRLISRQYSGGTPSDSFAYDAAGRLTRADSGQYGVVVTRAYDPANRLTTEAQVIDGLEFPVGYTYDALNRVIGQTYPDGTSSSRTYASRGELTSVNLGGDSIVSRIYDVGGRLVRSNMGNGVVEKRVYAPGDNLVTSISAATTANAPVTAFTYVYDANKRKMSEMDGMAVAADQRFGYDHQDRLTAWQRGALASPEALQSWSLTAVGDWASITSDGVIENRTHSDVHEVASINGAALIHDAKGNLTQAPGLPTLGWDVENRLISAQGIGPAGAVQASYRYDALGRRVQKVVNGKATTYLSAGAQTVVEVVGKLQNAPWINPLPELIPPATAGAPTGSILAQVGAGVVRVNFQPATSAVPTGWEPDVGTAFATQPSGHRFGWGSARTWSVDREALDVPTWDTSVKLADDATAPAGAEWSLELPNGTYPVIVILGDAASREQTNTVTVNGQVQTDVTPWVAGTPVGYEQGAFDGYAVTATVSDGRLRICPVAGQSWNAKLCCIEIGAQGTTIEAATQQRLADTVAMMNRATGSNRGTTPVVQRFAYGDYVDEVLSYKTVRKDDARRFFVHDNHLFSPVALTDEAGVVVERMTYDAYGKQFITTVAGAALAKSTTGFDRGFTGYISDQETGLMYARARYYSQGLGRFVGRDCHVKYFSHLARSPVWYEQLVSSYLTRAVIRNGRNQFGRTESEWISRMRDQVLNSYANVKETLVGNGVVGVLPGAGYSDGFSMYAAYFVPNRLDPSGEKTCIQLSGLVGAGLGATGSVSLCWDSCGKIWMEFAGGGGLVDGGLIGVSVVIAEGGYSGSGPGAQTTIQGGALAGLGGVEIPVEGPMTFGVETGLALGAGGGMSAEGTYTTPSTPGITPPPPPIRQPATGGVPINYNPVTGVSTWGGSIFGGR